MAITSQKSDTRPIGFLLWDDESNVEISSLTLIIRPEELTRQYVSRVTDYQTLKDIWVDDFGEGISQITIAGHTGWRGSVDRDGEFHFNFLRETVFYNWHRIRKARAESGQDPDKIQLIFTDELNGYAVIVVPKQFQLRRHKSKPLLYQYNIQMTVIGDASQAQSWEDMDSITKALKQPSSIRYDAARESMNNNLARQRALAKDLDKVLLGIGSKAKALMDTSDAMLQKTLSIADTVKGTFDAATAPVLYTSMKVQQASRNAFQILATPSNLAIGVKSALMRIAANFNDAYCNLRNGFNILGDFPDFSDWYGASTCSSTAGGRALSRFTSDNPWLNIYNDQDLPVQTDQRAADAIVALSNDPQGWTGTDDQVGDYLQDIADGVTVT